jgi:hypothetical protein
MKEEQTFYVLDRSPDESILHWMELVVRPALNMDHKNKSPFCIRGAVEYLKIPFPEGANFLGEKPKMN